MDKNKVADDKKILSKEYNIWMSKTKSSPYHFQSFFFKDHKLKKLCCNLKKLNDLSAVDKVKLRRDMQKVCEHNLVHYKRLQKRNTLIKIFHEILEEAKT